MSAHRLLEAGLKKCDIIKIPREFYWHYVFHIGRGICVHVRKEGEEAVKVAERLEDIKNNRFAEVDNPDFISWIRNSHERSESEAIQLAIEDLPLDDNGDVILGRPVKWRYFLASSNNCEGWCNYWKYWKMTGNESWSLQVNNPVVNTVVGEFERGADKKIRMAKEAISNEETHVVSKAIAAVEMVPYVGVSYAAAGIRHSSNLFASIFMSAWENPTGID